MKGLLLNSLYQSYKSTIMVISILGVMGFLLAIIDISSVAVIGFAFGLMIVMTILSLTFVQCDNETGWNIYTIILPIKKKKVIQSQYLFLFMHTLVGFIMNMIFVLMVVIFKGNIFFDFGMKDILTLYFISISISLQFISFYFITNFFLNLWGANFTIVISGIFSLAFSAFIITLLNKIGTSIETGRLIVLLISIFFVALSYRINVSKNTRKNND